MWKHADVFMPWKPRGTSASRVTEIGSSEMPW